MDQWMLAELEDMAKDLPAPCAAAVAAAEARGRAAADAEWLAATLTAAREGAASLCYVQCADGSLCNAFATHGHPNYTTDTCAAHAGDHREPDRFAAPLAALVDRALRGAR